MAIVLANRVSTVRFNRIIHPNGYEMETVSPSGADPIRLLLARWKSDPNATYQTWFLWEDRLKNFRSIRRGIAEVVAEIEAGTFGSNLHVRFLPYSELETHRHSMARFGQGMQAIEAVARAL
jgi:hypothetical protein